MGNYSSCDLETKKYLIDHFHGKILQRGVIFIMNNKIKTIQPSGILDSIHGNKLRREIIDLAESGADIILVNL